MDDYNVLPGERSAVGIFIYQMTTEGRTLHIGSVCRGTALHLGFRKQGGDCIALRVPANAFIGYSGDGWSCEAGYRKNDGACPAVAKR